MFGLRISALALAVLSTGLTAGVFYAYAISVMPALARTDARTLVDVMQKVNVVIINPWFMLAFMGTVGFTLLALLTNLGAPQRKTLILVAIALALNVIAFGVTAGANVPLNDALAAAGDPAAVPDLATVRADFEAAWVRWNIVRAVVHTVAFAVLCGALVTAGIAEGRVSAN
ncbi:anthrone oxygenase family protein [Nocardia camponoti]|uniref:Membrane protein n=1 Tax=Nocardia camponoti TaxID=1616106 RepID=A0A917QN50_9NOCA|nr:anthrone oxygenase family protein [Nocardia camponoti]GGK60211.1 membrane protein [Nocardia camponoti]